MVVLGSTSGAGRLLDCRFVLTDAGRGHLLDLCGPEEVVDQFLALPPHIARYRRGELDPELRPAWTHRLYAPGPAAPATMTLATLLGEVYTLPRITSVDAALVLGSYHESPDTDEPNRTDLGQLVHTGKYESRNRPTERAAAGSVLVERLTSAIRGHPLLAAAHVVLVPPGHDTRLVSFGGQLGFAVAGLISRPLVRVVDSTGQFRPPAGGGSLDERSELLRERFAVPVPLTDRTVLIVDDLVSSGATLHETARAARAAGAAAVYALAAVRTMRAGRW